jgi:hypothetical protein
MNGEYIRIQRTDVVQVIETQPIEAFFGRWRSPVVVGVRVGATSMPQRGIGM